MKKIRIRKPYFTAWKEFNWDQGSWGVHISMKMLERLADADEIIQVRFKEVKGVFEISAKEALAFVLANKTQTVIQVPQIAGVIPTKLMKQVKIKDNEKA